jgi:hypothetical protein
VAWDDRTPAEQAEEDQRDAARRDVDDDVIYVVTFPADKAKGWLASRAEVLGIVSARAVARPYNGTITPKGS